MKMFGKLAVITAIALASATGAVTASTATPARAAAAPPWYADTVYYTGGVATGSTRWYCNGSFRDDGDVMNYDYSVHTVYHSCP